MLKVLRLNDFAAAEAGGADADALSLTSYFRVHWTQVDVPASLGDVVRVTDAVSRLRLLAADITLLCHDYSQVNSDEFRCCEANLNFTGTWLDWANPGGMTLVAAMRYLIVCSPRFNPLPRLAIPSP